MKTPFDLKSNRDYEDWRSYKLHHSADYNSKDTPPPFERFSDTTSPTSKELNNILKRCQLHGFCLYRINNSEIKPHKKVIINLAESLGLKTLDGNICADDDKLTSITQTTHKGQHGYIPYSNKRLSWHTDGYYNTPEKRINSMLLHCELPAKEGGESLFLDHEIAYLLLRDESPEYIKALMQQDTMTIPANILDGKVIREEQTGPVFSVNAQGQLHMRYSARKRNIEWQQNSPTLEAVDFLNSLLLSDSKYIIKHTLKAGEGIICRNILHCRTAFVDSDDSDKKRLLYRGRYYDDLPIIN